jgi:hypothetical protein
MAAANCFTISASPACGSLWRIRVTVALAVAHVCGGGGGGGGAATTGTAGGAAS